MSRSILLLNVCLAALLAAGGMELRRRWLDAREREVQLLSVRPAKSAQNPPVATATPPAQKLQQMQYLEVAERFLFSRDRNPMVVIEKKEAPPPKPMPPLPNLYGVMDLGFGPTVFLSVGGAAQQGYKVGDKVGDFTLRAANSKDLTFDWEGKEVTKTLDEMRAQAKEAQPTAASAPAERFVANGNPAGFKEQQPVKPPENVKPAPGVDIGGGRKGCIAGDSSPTGTVADGYKKVSTSYAFGPICYWESSR